jgi:hypothetical protein
MKSRTMRWAGYVACMNDKNCTKKLWPENLKRKDHLEDLDMDRKIFLKFVLRWRFFQLQTHF